VKGARQSRRHRRRTVRVQVDYVSAFGRRSDTATTLGAGGLFVATDEPLDPESRIALRFRLPGGERLHTLQGRVVWANPPAKGRTRNVGMGIEFTEPAACVNLARELETLEPLDAA
jgi:uncharacterized protein (TIGR02266 family)